MIKDVKQLGGSLARLKKTQTTKKTKKKKLPNHPENQKHLLHKHYKRKKKERHFNKAILNALHLFKHKHKISTFRSLVHLNPLKHLVCLLALWSNPGQCWASALSQYFFYFMGRRRKVEIPIRQCFFFFKDIFESFQNSWIWLKVLWIFLLLLAYSTYNKEQSKRNCM